MFMMMLVVVVVLRSRCRTYAVVVSSVPNRTSALEGCGLEV